MSKGLNKYIASFDFLDKPLIALSVKIASISLTSIATVIKAPVEIVAARVSLEFFNFYGNCKKTVKKNEK